ncbi:MAG: histidine kinase dimerization/phospho-acceptor domain-containing protein, partial [Candidatus Longimicrobiales bacterium M2_2A_002]
MSGPSKPAPSDPARSAEADGESPARHPLHRPDREAVEEAARSVLENTADWRWHALKPEEAEQTMARLVDVVTSSADPTERAWRDECGGVLSLTLRLIELLRQELLRDPRGLSDPALLEVIRRLEACRARLEPRARQDLAYLLTGANSLELVVEFAHDLRSPLTSIMFLAETLRKGQSGEINDLQREQLGIVYSAALGMVGMANDLMDLASSEADDDWGDFAEE